MSIIECDGYEAKERDLFGIRREKTLGAEVDEEEHLRIYRG